MGTGPLPRQVSSRKEVDALLAAATNYEEKLPSSPRAFDLSRMQALLAEVGDPQRGVRTAHVAGSKGKGSVTRMLDAILRAAGRGSVGRYLSPHLTDLRERIAVDGVPVTDEVLARAGARVLPYATRTFGTPEAPTFFELLTAMAWLAFRERGCADVVLETGLGGRLDATNVCIPSATAITSIELEHTAILGSTIEEIAFEKAGILKKGVFGVTAAEGAALRVIEGRAREVGAPLSALGRDVALDRVASGPGPRTQGRVTFRGTAVEVSMPVAGVHQASNAALAVAMGLSMSAPPPAIVSALSTLRLPGTLEAVAREPVVVLDGAHTPASAARAREALAACWPGRPVSLVIAMLGEKDVRGVASTLARDVVHVVTTQVDSPRAFPAEDLARIVREQASAPVDWEPEPEEALKRAVERAGEWGLVLASGSVYLAGKLRALLAPKAAP
jgi:dihydrofolate synthase/folylpolyglutamate synthase